MVGQRKVQNETGETWTGETFLGHCAVETNSREKREATIFRIGL